MLMQMSEKCSYSATELKVRKRVLASVSECTALRLLLGSDCFSLLWSVNLMLSLLILPGI